MYNEKYYQDLYIKPVFMRLPLVKIYYLWTAYFCLKKAASLKRGERVLDVGCGIGNLVWALRKLGIKAYGVDPAKAPAKYCRAPLYCQYKSSKQLPYKDSSFDLVYTNEVLEHISPKNLSSFIQELLRVSKGKMIHMICVQERGDIIRSDLTHKIIKPESWWQKKFESTGFKVEKGNPFYFFPSLHHILSGKLRIQGIKKGYFYILKNKK